MKKLIFLFVFAVVLTGFALADSPAHPPGVMNLEAALFGYGADILAVMPDTVLVSAIETTRPASFQAVNVLAIRPQSGILNIPGMLLVYRQAQAVSAADVNYLLC